VRVGGTCGKCVRYFTNEAGGASSSVITEKARTPPQTTWHSFRAKLLDPPSAPILPCCTPALGSPLLPTPTSIPDLYPASDPPAPTQLPSASGSAPDSDPGSNQAGINTDASSATLLHNFWHHTQSRPPTPKCSPSWLWSYSITITRTTPARRSPGPGPNPTHMIEWWTDPLYRGQREHVTEEVARR
jgi:hypothetical protein